LASTKKRTASSRASRSAASVVWTQAGKRALAEEDARGIRLCDAPDPKGLVKIAAFAPAWQRGLPRSDATGRAIVARAIAWGKTRDKLTADDAAGIASLVGAWEPDNLAPFAEHVLRDYGWPFALDVLVAMWGLVTSYDNPDWPKSDARLAVWIRTMTPDYQHSHDASVSYGKGRFTDYLAKRARTARADAKTAAAARWKTAPLPAKAPLAVASGDPALAAKAVRELLAANGPFPHWGWKELPYVVTDPDVFAEIPHDPQPSLRVIENLGVAALPVYERRLEDKLDKHTRARVLAELANIRSPRVAKILAEYSDNKLCADTVRSYFTMHPDLLEQVLSDPDLVYHRDDLLALRPG
jgi:hypothetical protein